MWGSVSWNGVSSFLARVPPIALFYSDLPLGTGVEAPAPFVKLTVDPFNQ
jgi:hypothetical protein